MFEAKMLKEIVRFFMFSLNYIEIFTVLKGFDL